MTIPTRKYFVKVTAAISYDGQAYWQELHVKSLTSAQVDVDRSFAGFIEPEIGVSVDGVVMKVVSKKNKRGKWEVVHSKNARNNS